MRIIGTGLDRPSSTQLRAVQFGYAGLIPFGLAAVMTWLTPTLIPYGLATSFTGWVMLYGAIILSFMGGARWGVAIRDWRPDRLVLTVVPVLIAWFSVVPNSLLPGSGMGDVTRFTVLLVSFLLLLMSEMTTHGEWSPWYRGLRIRLSLTTAGLLALTILGLVRY